MKIPKMIPVFAAAVAAFALSGCGPDVEKSAQAAVERAFRAEGEVAKCAKVSNVRRVGEEPFLYTARALVKRNGVHSYYTISIEMIDEDAIVVVDKSSRTDLN